MATSTALSINVTSCLSFPPSHCVAAPGMLLFSFQVFFFAARVSKLAVELLYVSLLTTLSTLSKDFEAYRV